MKRRALVLVALLLLAAPAARAGGHWDDDDDSFSFHCDAPTRIGERHDVRDTRIAIDSENEKITLLLTNDVVAFQLSDRKMHDIRRKLRAKEYEDEDESGLATAIKTAVFAGVREMLAHSIEVPVREIRSVRYVDGELVFRGNDGDRLFDHDGDDVGQAFSDRDALAFVREFERVKSQRR